MLDRNHSCLSPAQPPHLPCLPSLLIWKMEIIKATLQGAAVKVNQVKHSTKSKSEYSFRGETLLVRRMDDPFRSTDQVEQFSVSINKAKLLEDKNPSERGVL